MFGDLSADRFRRAVISVWEKGQSRTEVHLVQFRDADGLGSRTLLSGQQSYMTGRDWAGRDGVEIPGSGNGLLYVYAKPHTEAGYLPTYQARALAARGDIVMDLWFYDTRPISQKTAMALAKRQLERL